MIRAPTSGAAEVCIGRQPIYDRSFEIYGYEVLARRTLENRYHEEDGDLASARVIESAMDTFGFGVLGHGKRIFVNITDRTLIRGFSFLLPREHTVLEILETVEPTPAVLEACAGLRKAGYHLALDDFDGHPSRDPFLPVVDILKIDFRLTTPNRRIELTRRHGGARIRLLAEKVETHRDLQEALKLGFHLFQGFVFSHPEVMSQRELQPFKMNYLQLLRELNEPEVSFADLEKIIQKDVSLSVKLLRFINSAMFGLRTPVKSICRALILLGIRTVRMWASLLAMIAMGEGKPHELIACSLRRSRFCEQLGSDLGLADRGFDLFLLGMLSVIDAILDLPMQDVIETLPLAPDVRGTLLGESTPLTPVLELARECEREEPTNERVAGRYQEACRWVEEVFAAVPR